MLDRSGEFRERTQRRYDDTALLLGEVLEHGPDSTRGRAAIRRINRQHGQWSIPNEYMVYVLCTFVVVPVRWLDRFGWRPLHPHERQAAFRYYARLGELMGIRDVPASYDELVDWFDVYEAAQFGRTDAVSRTHGRAAARRLRVSAGARRHGAAGDRRAVRAGTHRATAASPSPAGVRAGVPLHPVVPLRLQRGGAGTDAHDSFGVVDSAAMKAS